MFHHGLVGKNCLQRFFVSPVVINDFLFLSWLRFFIIMSTPTKEKRNICSSPVEKDVLLLCKETATESKNYGNKFRVRHLFKSLAGTSRSPSYLLLGLLSKFLKRALFFKLFYGKWGFLLVEKTPRLRLARLRVVSHFSSGIVERAKLIVHLAYTLIYLIHLREYFKV